MMLANTDMQTIARTRLMRHLDADARRALADDSTVRSYEKGQLIFHRGDDAVYFYAVLEGWAKVYRDTPGGEQAVLGIFGPGETFAEAAAFIGGRYPANAEAAEDVRLCLFTVASVKRLIGENPSIALAMLGSIAGHLHHIVADLEQLKTRRADQRLGVFLLGICGERRGRCRVSLPYDKALLAARLGMKPESLSRSLARLARIGVESHGHMVEIADVDALADYCQVGPSRR